MAGRIKVIAGDFFVDPLPPADIYGMGRILHDWTEEKIHHLLSKMYAACRPAAVFWSWRS